MDENEDTTTTEETTETTGTIGAESAPSLSDAITAALEPTLPTTEETTVEQPEGEPDGDAELEDDGAGDEGEGSGDDQPRDKDGKFVSADGKPGKPPADGDKPAGGEQPGKKTDPVNDPIPDDIKGRTRDRMTALIDTVKAKDEIITNQHTVIEAVKNTGASPEEFAAMISYMGWAHSDSKENLTKARDMLLAELEGISLKLGEAAPGIDFIAKHPDIKTMLDNGQITEDVAKELALGRTRTTRRTEAETATREQNEASNRATQERNAAIRELDDLGKTLAASDPDFARKHAILEPVLASLGQLPPKKWKAGFLAAYKAVKLPAAAPVNGSQPTNGGTPKGAPLRANKSPSGGQERKPASLLDAISAAVDEAGQR